MSSELAESDGVSRTGVVALVAALLLLGVFWSLGPAWKLAFLAMSVVVVSIGIWQACDPFADAAQWLGETFHIPGSVRGATLDAIASSMPELFSGIFFVVLAISSGGDSPRAIAEAGAEGYGATIATCAGSAVYNMILIPAAVALVISVRRKDRPTVDVEDEVIARDGLWFVACELILIVFLFENEMHWWMGIVFILLYVVYVLQLARDAQRYRGKLSAVRGALDELGQDADIAAIVGKLEADGVRVAPDVVYKIREGPLEEEGPEGVDAESARAVFGYLSIPLNHVSAWSIVVISTIAAAGACYFLVEVTRETATELQVPTFFVAVIVAAAASSVPDTFLSIGSALRGDDSGAVSNAFGSNIFDICICLSIPLLVNSYLTGWAPVSLLQDGEPIAGLVGLRILLVALTVVTLAIIWHNRQLTRGKAIFLCGLYGLFVGYAVLGSLGIL